MAEVEKDTGLKTALETAALGHLYRQCLSEKVSKYLN